jgi:hypothetical protein
MSRGRYSCEILNALNMLGYHILLARNLVLQWIITVTTLYIGMVFNSSFCCSFPPTILLKAAAGKRLPFRILELQAHASSSSNRSDWSCGSSTLFTNSYILLRFRSFLLSSDVVKICGDSKFFQLAILGDLRLSQ